MTLTTGGGACLYKEARLNLEPAFPGSTVSITLPTNTTTTFGSRPRTQRNIVTESYVDQDEEVFKKRHLASDGSIFFRAHHTYPRSFLWRVLDGRKALEIQSVDLDSDFTHKFEANLTLLLHFPSPIRPFCVGCAEPEDRDAIIVFAITTANELYTITLHRDFFVRAAASELDIRDWCKVSSPNLLKLRVPYRLSVISDMELLLSVDNGAILRFHKLKKESVSWEEGFYKHNPGFIGGLLSWKGQQTVRFDDVDLDGSAAPSVAYSPDKKHILAVSLDHRLKAFNTASGRLGMEIDLLGEPQRPNDKAAQYFIGPSQAKLMEVLDIRGGVDGAEYHVLTYSPKQHQFKFWGVVDADEPDGVRDIQSDNTFIPPIDALMNTTVWTLEEFHFQHGPAGWRGSELWIRVRSGPSSKVYSLKFDLYDTASLDSVWKNDWVSVEKGPLTVDGLKQNPANPGEQDLEVQELDPPGLTEKWLEFLFYPGRFTIATLESALVLFRRGLKQESVSKLPRHGSLKERICAAVAALVNAGQTDTSNADEYEEAVSAQWQAFYGLVKDFHRRRGESLSLVLDRASDMPWLIQSDYVTPIRACNTPEALRLNAAALSPSHSHNLSHPLRKLFERPDLRDVSNLLKAAATFRRSFPASFHHQFQQQLTGDLLQNHSLSVIERMALMDEKTSLSEQVSEDDISLLVEELGADVNNVTSELFLRAIENLGQELQGTKKQVKQITRFGIKALVEISQETLDMNYEILLDILVLILFMAFEEELSDEFDASDIFVEVVNQLKDNMVLTWLATRTWAHQTAYGPANAALLTSLSTQFNNSKTFPMTQTVLEGIYGHRAFDLPLPKSLKPQHLTYWSGAWLGVPFFDQSYDATLEEVFTILIQQNELGLALDFSKFLSEENWTSYLKGRMHLALGEFALASISFQKPAYNLALGLFNVEDADSVSFIPLNERGSFSEGLPKYYQHVLGLFDKAKAHSYVAEFANLALRSFTGSEEDGLKSDLLSRLFNASIQTSRFDDAYSALTRQLDTSLQRSALHTLVTTMVKQGQSDSLLKFPFVGLTDEVDAYLAYMAQNSLNLATGPPFHQILYSFRISRNNFRGAAAVLYERLQRLKNTSSKIHNPEDESLVQCYLMIINTLSSVSEEEAYILAEASVNDGGTWALGTGRKLLKRQIVTLDSLRKEYQAELDRVATIESGQYPFVDVGDEMDIL